MTCHHIPSVRCPECVDNRPSMGYWPTPCGTCAALREENARLRLLATDWDAKAMKLAEVTVERLTRERDEARERVEQQNGTLLGLSNEIRRLRDIISPGNAAAYEEGMAALQDKLARCVEALKAQPCACAAKDDRVFTCNRCDALKRAKGE